MEKFGIVNPEAAKVVISLEEERRKAQRAKRFGLKVEDPVSYSFIHSFSEFIHSYLNSNS